MIIIISSNSLDIVHVMTYDLVMSSVIIVHKIGDAFRANRLLLEMIMKRDFRSVLFIRVPNLQNGRSFMSLETFSSTSLYLTHVLYRFT